MNKTLLKMAVSFGAIFPLFAFAQTGANADVEGILGIIRNLLNQIIPILMVVATIVFLWGIVMYITAAGDEKKAATAKTYITSGIIGLFFMVAIWGIVTVIVNTFQVGGGIIPEGPGEL